MNRALLLSSIASLVPASRRLNNESKISSTVPSDCRLRLNTFPPRLRQRYSTPRNLRFNQTQSKFYHLPAELHLYIASSLSGPDLLSYAYCSHETYFLSMQLQPHRSVKADFAARLRRDRKIRALVLRDADAEGVA